MATAAEAEGRRSHSGYSKRSIALHWTIVLLVVANVVLAVIFNRLLDDAVSGDQAQRGELIGLHKSIGATILVLTLLRLANRLREGFPPFPPHTPGWQRVVARGNHYAFYVLLLAVPLAGWAFSSAAGRPVDYFGMFELPMLPVGASSEDFFHEAHEWLARLTVALVLLHVAGALKHHFFDKDDVLARMLPVVKPKRD